MNQKAHFMKYISQKISDFIRVEEICQAHDGSLLNFTMSETFHKKKCFEKIFTRERLREKANRKLTDSSTCKKTVLPLNNDVVHIVKILQATFQETFLNELSQNHPNITKSTF